MSDFPRRLASEARIDHAIDRAVRDMMHVDPRPGFRGRVLARLDPEPVRRSVPALWRFAVLAGAVAVLVLAVMVVVPDRRSELPKQSAQQATPKAQSVSRAVPPSSSRSEATVLPGTRQRGPTRTHTIPAEALTMPRVSNVFGDRNAGVAGAAVETETVWPAPAVNADEPSGTLTPLSIPPLEPPAPIVIAPLPTRGPGRP